MREPLFIQISQKQIWTLEKGFKFKQTTETQKQDLAFDTSPEERTQNWNIPAATRGNQGGANEENTSVCLTSERSGLKEAPLTPGALRQS